MHGFAVWRARLGFLFIVILVGLNVAVLARAVDVIRLPGEVSDSEIMKEGAYALADYYESVAQKSGLDKNTAVRDALAKFKFEIEEAVSADEIAYAVGYYGRSIQDVLAREDENRRREILLQILNADPGLHRFQGQATITISVSKDGVTVDDRQGILSQETVRAIVASEAAKGLVQSVDIEIVDGKANVLTPRTMIDRVRILQDEVAGLRNTLEDLKRTAGFAPMTGQGVVVRIYDAEGGVSKDEIVQEKDVRDVVNELFAAGALGVEVGGQRIVATSSIRSAGPQILVNHKAIPVNPVVIKAVGDPELLESSLDLIRNSLEPWGIRMVIEKRAAVSLSAFQTKS